MKMLYHKAIEQVNLKKRPVMQKTQYKLYTFACIRKYVLVNNFLID